MSRVTLYVIERKRVRGVRRRERAIRNERGAAQTGLDAHEDRDGQARPLQGDALFDSDGWRR